VINTLISLFGAASAVVMLSGFIPGGARNTFINGTRAEIRISYQSTTLKLDKAVVIRPGGGLQMTGDSGKLLRLTVRYPKTKVLNSSAKAISRIEASSQLKNGVWWITDTGVEYISTKESLVRSKRVFGHW
jgi:hypothetical protein